VGNGVGEDLPLAATAVGRYPFERGHPATPRFEVNG
jgi:hypothetical protein